jgi:hypothetical protein
MVALDTGLCRMRGRYTMHTRTEGRLERS